MKRQVPNWVKGNEGLLLKAALLGIGYFAIVHPILKAVGFIESKEDRDKRKTDEQNAVGTGAFDPNYYKSIPGAKLITKAVADNYAKTIYEADAYFNDDEAAVFGVFRQLSAKTQVSWLAERFYALYGADLYNYMRAFLDDDEMSTVNGIVNNLS